MKLFVLMNKIFSFQCPLICAIKFKLPKNPECESVRDFTFSFFTFHYSLKLAFGIFGK